MKSKTIKSVLRKKIDEWAASIDDEDVRKLVLRDTIVTGGCIASMLLKEKVNDYDIYFLTKETTQAVAEYYVAKFNTSHGAEVEVKTDDTGRIRIFVPSAGVAGFAEKDMASVETLSNDPDMDDDETPEAAPEDSGKPKYRPVFLSTNAITLSDRIQIVTRFYGKPDEIHENYDFVHCTNYWKAHGNELVLRSEALEALLARELTYVGSKYPVCSVMRLRKFIKRGWTINAGQILKIALQISALDMTDFKVLEDQLTGVDSFYFLQVVAAVKEKDPERVDTSYLVEVINRMFG